MARVLQLLLASLSLLSILAHDFTVLVHSPCSHIRNGQMLLVEKL